MPAESDDVVVADGWFPVGLWLGPTTCLVRVDEGPDESVVDRLKATLTELGCGPVDVAEDLQAAMLALTMTRVDVIAGTWNVWSVDEPTARAAITAEATA